MTHLICELSDAEQWPSPAWAPGKTIPARRRPSMLQPDRETAEKEALRLAGQHPGRRFVVFAPVAAGVTAQVPTHTNLRGETVHSRSVAALVQIDDGERDDVPF